MERLPQFALAVDGTKINDTPRKTSPCEPVCGETNRSGAALQHQSLEKTFEPHRRRQNPRQKTRLRPSSDSSVQNNLAESPANARILQSLSEMSIWGECLVAEAVLPNWSGDEIPCEQGK